MADPDWSRIQTWQTFEALVRTIVLAQDPEARPLSRPGPDGGQDVRSSDDTRVYQAKHHKNQSPKKAIADARSEARKIAEYREVSHKHHSKWEGVTRWTLVTNACFNSDDDERWTNEVRPQFADLGIDADYWECAKLEALLAEFPQIERRFFGGEVACFLTLTEAREKMSSSEPFLHRSSLGRFRGRTEECEEIKSFLGADKLFLVIHGQGGVGKTRTLLEAAKEIEEDGKWQVLWANVSTMERSDSWFEGIVTEKPTLMVVDEPESEDILKTLVEQLGGHLARTSEWKVVITVRTPKDPVMGFLRDSRHKHRVKELPIDPLPEEDASSMMADLMLDSRELDWSEEKTHSVASEICGTIAGSLNPIWLTLIVRLLERKIGIDQLPTSGPELAESYLSEILGRKGETRTENQCLLRWIALLGPVNREDRVIVDHLAKKAGFESGNQALAAINRLIYRRALTKRGARDRLVEVKPDVIRDHILLTWLADDIGFGDNSWQASNDAVEISNEILDSALAGHLDGSGTFALAIIPSIARIETVLRHSGQSVDILGHFVASFVRAMPTLAAHGRMEATELFRRIAPFRPTDVVKFTQAARATPCDTATIESVFGPKSIGFYDVGMALAWVVYEAAFGAETFDERRIVLLELCELAEFEEELANESGRTPPRDGRRAAELVRRVVDGDHGFWGNFDDAVAFVGEALFERVFSGPACENGRAALLSLMGPVLSLERSKAWFDDHSFIVERSLVLPATPAWANRERFLDILKARLQDSAIPVDFQGQLWKVFVNYFYDLNSQRDRHEESVEKLIRYELLESLAWAREALQSKVDEFAVVHEASRIWRDLLHHEDDPEILAALRALDEGVYRKNATAAEFGDLLSLANYDKRNDEMARKALDLSGRPAEEIDRYLSSAAEFLGGEANLTEISDLARELGKVSPESASVREFVERALADPVVTGRSKFVGSIIRSQVFSIRDTQPERVPGFLMKLLGLCGSDAQRVSLLLQVYGIAFRPGTVAKMAGEEFSLIRARRNLFATEQALQDFVPCIAWGFRFDWPELRKLLDGIINQMADLELTRSLYLLVSSIAIGLQETTLEEVPPDLHVWLLDHLMRLDDIGFLRNSEFHSVEMILQTTGRPKVSWLVGVLRRRHEMEVEGQKSSVKALGHRAPIAQLVSPLTEGEVLDLRNDMKELVSLSMCTGSVGLYLHEVVRKVDPRGLLVPELAGEVLRDVAGCAERRRLARLGIAYVVGSPQWRQLSAPFLEWTKKVGGKKEQYAMYRALSEPGISSTSGTWGEVPSSVVQDVEVARKQLGSETDPAFIPFWEWRVKCAEASLEAYEQIAKEDRGQ